MGKVRMRNVHDDQVYEFDAGPGNAELRKAIESGDWVQELNPAQQIVKGVSDWAPAIGSGLGAAFGAAGGTLGAGAPTLGAGAIPGGMAGGVAGGLYGGLLGASARELGYDAAGIQRDTRPLPMAGRFAAEGAGGMLTGMGQAFGYQPRPEVANQMMKGAVGNAQPEIEQAMVRRGITVDSRGRKAAVMAMRQLSQTKRDIIDHWQASGLNFGWKHLRDVLRGEVRGVRAADPISTENEAGLAQALKVLEQKFGPRYKARGPVEDPMAVGQVNLGRAKRVVEKPGDKFTPSQLEAIRRFASNRVKQYQRARMAQEVAVEGPLEYGYRVIAERAASMLNKMSDPQTGRTLGDVNADIGEYRDIARAVTVALKRSPGRANALSATIGATTTAAGPLWSHDPMRAAVLAVPGAAAGYAMSTPQALSRTAIALSRPSMVRGAFGQALPQAVMAGARMAGFSDPELKPKPLPDELQPDYMK